MLVVSFLGLSNFASAQQTLRERLEQKQTTEDVNKVSSMSVRAIQASRSQTVDIDNAKWSRTIYRYLDLNKDGNASLYYPLIPEGGQMNLFSKIFRLLADDKISAYEYLDGREVFTDDYKIDFVEFLDRFDIYYKMQDNEPLIDDVDIPSNEVQGYFVKEVNYFDSRSSDIKTEVVAICPVIHRQGDYDAVSTRYPLFWIPYSDIKPYALGMPIMASGLNNSMAGTVDDFFIKRKYDGEIYKAANPRNLTVAQQVASEEDLAKAQKNIDQQLKDFEISLWREHTDSTKVIIDKKKRISKRISPKIGASKSETSTNSMRERRY